MLELLRACPHRLQTEPQSSASPAAHYLQINDSPCLWCSTHAVHSKKWKWSCSVNSDIDLIPLFHCCVFIRRICNRQKSSGVHSGALWFSLSSPPPPSLSEGEEKPCIHHYWSVSTINWSCPLFLEHFDICDVLSCSGIDKLLDLIQSGQAS